MGIEITAQNEKNLSPALQTESLTYAEIIEKVLQEHGKPLHIIHILSDIMNKYGRKTTRESVEVALARSMKKDGIFEKTGPATYGLKIWRPRRTIINNDKSN